MAIYVTGDTHREMDRLYRFNKNNNLTKDDYLIVLGDFGFIWSGDQADCRLLNCIDKFKFTTLFIDGNHDNFERLYDFKKGVWNGGKIHRIRDSIFHLRRGQVFNINGLRFFTFGGANSIDKIYRTEGISWWKEEVPNQKELIEGTTNLQNHDYTVDYVLTHECPREAFAQLKCYFPHMHKSFGNEVKEMLSSYYYLLDFKKWFFGHYHEVLDIDKFELLYRNIKRID